MPGPKAWLVATSVAQIKDGGDRFSGYELKLKDVHHKGIANTLCTSDYRRFFTRCVLSVSIKENLEPTLAGALYI